MFGLAPRHPTQEGAAPHGLSCRCRHEGCQGVQACQLPAPIFVCCF